MFNFLIVFLPSSSCPINRTIAILGDNLHVDPKYADRSALTNLVIDGQGIWAVDGADSVRCFFIDGVGTEVRGLKMASTLFF